MFNCMVKFIHFQKFNTADTTYKACKMLVLTTIYQLYTIYNTDTIFFGNIGFIYTYNNGVQGSCKKFCHWVQITSVLRFTKHIFITNLQSIPPILKHIFVTFLPVVKSR